MKAVLVLCEGRHEVVFVQRSLGAVAGCRWVNEPMKDLPSPFGAIPGISKGLIARRFERSFEDLALRRAAYPPLPHFESAVDKQAAGIVFILVRANGKSQADSIVDLLQEVDESLRVPAVDILEYAVAFLFDADADRLTATLEAFREDYGEHFGDLSDAGHAKWVATATCPVGVFVFHKTEADETGTLEDHLAPMVESAWPDRYAVARGFIDDNRKPCDEVSRNDATRLKAIITSAGQFAHPGSPLSTMIARDGIPETQFAASPMSRALVDFLKGAPWRNHQSSTCAA